MFYTILFTHNDLDGAGCRVLFDVAFGFSHQKGEYYEIINCSNEDIDRQVETAIDLGYITKRTVVYFADIVPAREILKKLQNLGCVLMIFDHHRTNFFAEHEIQPPSICRIVPENDLGIMQSGTSLLYQFLAMELGPAHPFNVKSRLIALGAFADIVRAYDTYEFKMTNNLQAPRLQMLYTMLGMDHFCNMYVERYASEEYGGPLIPSMADFFITAKMDMEQKAIDRFSLDDVTVCTVNGYKCALLIKYAGARFSELAYQFLSKHPEIDFMASFSFFNGGEFQFRTIREDLNTGEEIALPLDGGGHPKASGAPLSDIMKDAIADIIVNYMNGHPIQTINYQ